MDKLPAAPRCRDRSLLAEDTAALGAGPLLSAKELLCAMRGDYAGDHPLARWARRLAELHRTPRLTGSAGICGEKCCAREDLVHAIDVWTERNVPQHRHGVALHTETLGSVIDRIADAQSRATTVLMSSQTAADPRVHAAWHRLAELVDGYNDLIAQVTDGVRRLPAPAGEDW
ncbi:DUF4254 domain-containing protein [Nocardia sp. NBC_00508]|uniref:DUF4254 domain-containing protein n=1 Tax=Nocardia sp. NBC_00508 TaxID=2975992 RepID=UPI002E8227D9|nr:DUF4254 domain-containing protein [Nocardia sp. NBC_00508]WUD68955.1 DUF4254 domain-containing protein [Nocardia sp. NBC_00508]